VLKLADARQAKLDARAKKLLEMWPQMQAAYAGDEYVVKIRAANCAPSSPRSRCRQHHPQGRAAALRGPRRVAEVAAAGERARLVPYTAGVFAFKRENEDPTRMFAGEGDAFRTNKRFKRVSKACRRSVVHRVRFGHVVRLRAGRAPGHLRQGRQFGRVDRDAGRHQVLYDASICAARTPRCR